MLLVMQPAGHGTASLLGATETASRKRAVASLGYGASRLPLPPEQPSDDGPEELARRARPRRELRVLGAVAKKRRRLRLRLLRNPSGVSCGHARPSQIPFNVAAEPWPTSPITGIVKHDREPAKGGWVKRPAHRHSASWDARAPMRRELVCRSEGVGAAPVAPLPHLRREESFSDPSAAERTWV
jgi:hypothetical protein